MENNSQYRLKEKYNGLSLNDNSSVMVNNRNITDEYAVELLKRFAPETIFDKFPKVEQMENKEFEEVEIKEVLAEAQAFKKKRNRILNTK